MGLEVGTWRAQKLGKEASPCGSLSNAACTLGYHTFEARWSGL